jgi:hypothetical protein
MDIFSSVPVVDGFHQARGRLNEIATRFLVLQDERHLGGARSMSAVAKRAQRIIAQ